MPEQPGRHCLTALLDVRRACQRVVPVSWSCVWTSVELRRTAYKVTAGYLAAHGDNLPQPLTFAGTISCLMMPLCTMRFGSSAKVLAKCKLKYYRISECWVLDELDHHKMSCTTAKW